MPSVFPTRAPTPLATPAPAVVAASVLGALLGLLGIGGALYVRRMVINKKKMMKIAVGDGNAAEQSPDAGLYHSPEVPLPPALSRIPCSTPT